MKFQVLRRTERGVWLVTGEFGRPRFVLDRAIKRFACPTIEEALESFRARKIKQAAIHRALAARAELAVRLAETYVRRKERERGEELVE